MPSKLSKLTRWTRRAAGGARLERVAYREETERLRARVEELDQELGAAKQQIAKLTPNPNTPALAARLLGGSLLVVREARVEREVSLVEREDILEPLRRRFGVSGDTTIEGRTLTWTSKGLEHSRRVEVSVTTQDGATLIRAGEGMGVDAYFLFFMGGVMAPVFSAVGCRIAGLSLFWVIPFVVLVLAGVRSRFSAHVLRSERELGRAVQEVADIVSSADEPARVTVQPTR